MEDDHDLTEDLLQVTAKQYHEGYIEMVEGIVYTRRYRPVKQNPDGTWVVTNPRYLKAVERRRQQDATDAERRRRLS